MKLELNISPCPNDTFMFDALVNGLIDTGGLEFDVSFADIEQLNRGVVSGRALVSKVSCAVLPLIAGRYKVLDSGAALGRGNGPLLVAPGEVELEADPLVAVPGFHTTANLLMSKIFPQVVRKEELLFSQIADAVLDGRYDAGVLIHEGRFTYRQRGLSLAADLGAEWERLTGLPLPLGAIVVSREVPVELQKRVEALLRRSVQYAVDNGSYGSAFVRGNAQEMAPEVLRSHIEMFVNDYSLSLGAEGREAIKYLTGLTDEIFV